MKAEEWTAKMLEDGAITLPVPLIEKLGVQEGDEFLFHMDESGKRCFLDLVSKERPPHVLFNEVQD